ncbi:hypothetical protein E2C01_016671 [Portunus trituberculatus]|uniref:Uncharacterized protein n=1 Tax=Portunus trituberculatus TaxID=210409 RepID=A0A5B7DRE4_PORTR|nr:hypothetical protein [Portunus trituberculatus]
MAWICSCMDSRSCWGPLSPSPPPGSPLTGGEVVRQGDLRPWFLRMEEIWSCRGAAVRQVLQRRRRRGIDGLILEVDAVGVQQHLVGEAKVAVWAVQRLLLVSLTVAVQEPENHNISHNTTTTTTLAAANTDTTTLTQH